MDEGFVTVQGQNIRVSKKALNLDGLRIKNILDIEGLESLYDLEVLRLNNNQISEIKGLEVLPNLQFLNLSQNQITEIEGLDELRKLKNLDLSYNQITEIKGLDNLVNLEYLTLDSNQITEIKGIENLKKLKWLSLFDNPIKEEHQKFLDEDVSVIRDYLQAQIDEWKNSIVKYFCIHSEMGASIFHHDFTKGTVEIDEQLFAGGLSGITSLIKEMTKSDKQTRVIDQEDKKILLEFGNQVTSVLISTLNLDILHEKLYEINKEIEAKYGDILTNFTGRVDDLKEGILNIVKSHFY
ncbi:MAG: leucine-rich repeat protein [Candidatus Helarchaeota archaeon]